MGYAPGVQTQEVSRNLMTNGLLNGEKSEMSDEMRTRPPDANRTSPTTGGSTVSRVFFAEGGIAAGGGWLSFVRVFKGRITALFQLLAHSLQLKPKWPSQPALSVCRDHYRVLL